MQAAEYLGFWSYAHRDNDLDRGRIAELAKSISDEFELQTGNTLRMFVDENSLRWGDEWREGIDQSLDHCIFFIAIITPLYLQSEQCRREFLDFASQLRAGRQASVLLPILYSDIPLAADPGSEDEIVRIVRQTQWEDWRQLRLSESDSSQYRRKVAGMVSRIIAIVRAV